MSGLAAGAAVAAAPGFKKRRSEWDPLLKRAAGSTEPTKAARKRIKKDIRALLKAPLPGILAMPDPETMCLVHAIIHGPADTPYHGGLFYFVLWFPPDYPNHPPCVRIMTTGGGTVRFNPNLYKNGKVCLSILGTWAGPSWSPVHTLGSVLLSIQSLMCPNPYHNEPGFETERQAGDSTSYNNIIRHETMRVAVAGMLEKPPPTMPELLVGTMREVVSSLGETFADACRGNRRLDNAPMRDPFGEPRGKFNFTAILKRLQALGICTSAERTNAKGVGADGSGAGEAKVSLSS